MSKLISCEFNIDTACVELLFADGSMISIDCIAVENEIADNRFDRAELDWLLYNKPLEYADLVLNGGIEEYCKTSREHSTIEDSTFIQSAIADEADSFAMALFDYRE